MKVLIVFALSILLMILLVTRGKMHPTLGILLSVLFLAFGISTPLGEIIPTINQGFADTVKSVAIVLFLGSLLGLYLEESGAAIRMTNQIIKSFGEKNVLWAISISAAIISIPVFADSTVILLMPIVSNLAIETDESMMKYGGALYLGALVTSSLVPPTPGPVAAAALLDIPLGDAIFWGIVVSIPSILAGVLYLRTLNEKVLPKEEFILNHKKDEKDKLPSLGASMFPIFLPIVLIMLNTFLKANWPESQISEIFGFLGDPVTALLIACAVSSYLVRQEGLNTIFNKWAEDALKISVMPIFVTGLGGSLAIFIKNSGVAEDLAKAVIGFGIPGIFIPIVVAALIHIVTGSNTLGVMTTAALMQPILGDLGISPLATFLACGTGAMMFKHSNSSGFWVTTSLSNMSLTQGLRTIGGFTTFSGLAGALFTVLLNFLGWI